MTREASRADGQRSMIESVVFRTDSESAHRAWGVAPGRALSASHFGV